MRHLFCGARRGFTLVEILVVIGIIGLLISMLMPVLGAARRAGNTVRCASNLRQVGLAIELYAQKNDQMLPYAGFSTDDDAIEIGWDDLLDRELGGQLTGPEINARWSTKPRAVLLCPADPIPSQFAPDSHRKSYGIVRVLNGHAPPRLSFEGIAAQASIPTPTSPLTMRLSLKQSEIRRPSELLVIVEAPHRWNVLGTAHGVNYSFIDKPADQSQFTSFTADSLTPAQARQTFHGERWNYLFADGHVAALRVEDTVSRSPGQEPNLFRASGMWTRNPID
jgi:prepilin-type N-terminal cleavage/methylation domain-containing protein/prepilin-type processing-associated H-X9-DG protein